MRKIALNLVLAVSLSLVSVCPSHAENSIELEGAAQSGGLMLARVNNAERVYLNEQEIDINQAGIAVFGFGRDTSGPQQLKVIYKNGQQQLQTIHVEARDYQIDYVDGVPQRTVTPNPEQQARARKEAERVWLARQTISTRTDFLAAPIMPAKGRISGVYGSQRVFNGTPRNPHYGLDIAAPTGTPVYAPWSGKVVFADADLFYSGGTLIIDHGQGITSTYIHLSKLDVKVGDEILQGDKIAEIGATGRVTGPHLDWRINWLNERLDPALVLEYFADIKIPQS